jgi:SAM-dependent methyltransferase
MSDEEDLSSLPGAASAWLEAHHRAKLPERRAFCQRLAALRPSSVLDLGCGTGLWLDELNKVLPQDCEFIGMDSKESSLAEATERAKRWSRRSSFQQVDLNATPLTLPHADLTLLFNVSSYLRRLDHLIVTLARRPGNVVIRQYDGAAMRFGPMSVDDRVLIETSLRHSMRKYPEYWHYDLDRLYTAIEQAPFTRRKFSLEVFTRSSPFPDQFADYLSGTMSWILESLSDPARNCLQSWWASRQRDPSLPTYFIEVDLCAMLS